MEAFEFPQSGHITRSTSSRHPGLALPKSVDSRKCGRCAILLKNGRLATHLEGCVGCTRGDENTSRISSIRSAAAPRRTIYPAVKDLREMSRREQIVASVGTRTTGCKTEAQRMMEHPQGNAVPKQTPLQRWLRIAPERKSAVYAQIYDTAEISSLYYWLEIIFSAGIAALGLVLNSPAVTR